MNIKFTLLAAFVLASLNVNTSPLIHESPDIITSPVLQNTIEVIIDDASYTFGDTYTVNVYYLGTLHSSQTTNSLQTMAIIPALWRGSLIVEIEKHPANLRVVGIEGTFQIIAQEVRYPDMQAIVEFE